MSENRNELYAALSKAQGEFMGASKDSDNPFFKSKYASHSSIVQACQQALTKNGLSILQPIDTLDGKEYVTTILAHSSGQYVTSCVEVIVDPNSKNYTQARGACQTYLRRYALQSMLNIAFVSDDDDGNSQGAYHGTPKPNEPVIDEGQKDVLIDLYQILSEENKSVAIRALNALETKKFEELPVKHFHSYANVLNQLKVNEQASFLEDVENV